MEPHQKSKCNLNNHLMSQQFSCLKMLTLSIIVYFMQLDSLMYERYAILTQFMFLFCCCQPCASQESN